MKTLRVAALAAALAAAAWAAGCTVDQAKETAAYRQALNEKMAPPGPLLPPGEVLTLTQALAMANAHNERLALGGEDYLQALIEKDRAISRLLPSISVAPAYQRLEHFSAPGPVGGIFPNPATDVPLRTTLNIDLANVAEVQKAEVLARYRLAVLLNLQADILVATAETYYQVLRLERQIGVLENFVSVQETRVADIRDKVKAGVARQLDLRQTEADAAGARAALIDARNKRAAARAGLALLIGAPAVENPLADGFEAPPAPPLEDLQRQAVQRRHDVLAAEALVAAAERGLSAAVAEYFPSVSVDFDYFLSRQSFPRDSLWAFGVGANLPLFAGGRIHAGVRTAYSFVRQAQAYESLTRRQAAEQVKVAYEDLDASGQRLREFQAQVAAAREASALADQAYDVGLGTNLERLIAQDRLQQAELALAAESLNRKIMYLRLVRQTGTLVDEAGRLAGPAAAPPPAADASAEGSNAGGAENAEKSKAE